MLKKFSYLWWMPLGNHARSLVELKQPAFVAIIYQNIYTKQHVATISGSSAAEATYGFRICCPVSSCMSWRLDSTYKNRKEDAWWTILLYLFYKIFLLILHLLLLLLKLLLEYPFMLLALRLQSSNLIFKIFDSLLFFIAELRDILNMVVSLPQFHLKIMRLLFYLIDLDHVWINVFGWSI